MAMQSLYFRLFTPIDVTQNSKYITEFDYVKCNDFFVNISFSNKGVKFMKKDLLKRMLAVSLSVMMLGTTLIGCGGSKETTTKETGATEFRKVYP